METQLNRHDDMLSMHEIRLADMDLRFQVLETASYNGTLIWKIRDYKRRKQEAVAAKTLSLYSQPFYTGYFGYKVGLTSDTSNTAGNKTDSELSQVVQQTEEMVFNHRYTKEPSALVFQKQNLHRQ